MVGFSTSMACSEEPATHSPPIHMDRVMVPSLHKT
jgi:hypothetical protein